MTEVSSPAELLIDCLHDLADGERQIVDRLGEISAQICDTELREAFERIVPQARERARRLKRSMETIDAAEPDASNIWMRGILDDAQRDTEMVQPGQLLDIALIGALRKALASLIVSYETAVIVARSSREPEIDETLDDILREVREADRRQRSFLEDAVRDDRTLPSGDGSNKTQDK